MDESAIGTAGNYTLTALQKTGPQRCASPRPGELINIDQCGGTERRHAQRLKMRAMRRRARVSEIHGEVYSTRGPGHAAGRLRVSAAATTSGGGLDGARGGANRSTPP